MIFLIKCNESIPQFSMTYGKFSKTPRAIHRSGLLLYPKYVASILRIFPLSKNTSFLIAIAAAYSQRTGEDFPVKGSTRTQMCFVLTIPYIACFTSRIGTLRFFTFEANQE